VDPLFAFDTDDMNGFVGNRDSGRESYERQVDDWDAGLDDLFSRFPSGPRIVQQRIRRHPDARYLSHSIKYLIL
jgi:hypothetical protein